jgi:hypothetical protein
MERHIHQTQPVRTSVDLVTRVLTGPAGVLGERHGRKAGEPATYLTDVEVALGAGASVHEQVKLTCHRRFSGPVGAAVWDLDWEPVGRRRLLPAFHGHLTASPSSDGAELQLDGSYRPPLRAVGAAGDALVGRRVAERTLGSFLAGLAERIDREAQARHEPTEAVPQASAGPAPATEHPENWLG